MRYWTKEGVRTVVMPPLTYVYASVNMQLTYSIQIKSNVTIYSGNV